MEHLFRTYSKMDMHFTEQESSVLYGLLAETTQDIILKTDREGFIVHASPAIGDLGLLLPEMLIGPRLADLAASSHAEAIRAAHEAAMAGMPREGWIEFPAIAAEHAERWFSLRMRCLTDVAGAVYGVLCVMRNIDERRRLEDRLFAAAMTDPLTGLTNRRAFVAMLQHMVDTGIDGCLALFDIDYFRAINMQHGQAVGDEVLLAMTDLLRAMMRSRDIISRIGGESFAVLLPGTTLEEAQAICQPVITTLSELSRTEGFRNPPITASAGLARIGTSLDGALKKAEQALFFAKATGRDRLEIDCDRRFPWTRTSAAA